MNLSGSRALPFPRAAVWEALMDPEVLSRTLPGCERLERTAPDSFAGTLMVQIGPVRGRFEGTLELTELEPPESYRMKLVGEGPSGFMSGEGSVRLEEEGPGTVVSYDLEAQVGGRIAGVGQRLLDSSARVIAQQGLDGLERQLAARHPPAETPSAEHVEAPARPAVANGAPAPVDRPPAPGQTAFALSFVRGLWKEMVPAPARPWVLAGMVVVLVLAILLLVRACSG